MSTFRYALPRYLVLTFPFPNQRSRGGLIEAEEECSRSLGTWHWQPACFPLCRRQLFDRPVAITEAFEQFLSTLRPDGRCLDEFLDSSKYSQLACAPICWYQMLLDRSFFQNVENYRHNTARVLMIIFLAIFILVANKQHYLRAFGGSSWQSTFSLSLQAQWPRSEWFILGQIQIHQYYSSTEKFASMVNA